MFNIYCVGVSAIQAQCGESDSVSIKILRLSALSEICDSSIGRGRV